MDYAVTCQCPDLLAYEGDLAREPGIVEDGYKYIRTAEHPRVGTVDMVGLTLDDGEVYITNSRDTAFCQVAFSGPGARAVFEQLILDYPRIDTGLRPETVARQIEAGMEGSRIVQFRTEAFDGQYLGVQFVDLAPIDPTAPLTIQQYVLEE